jgi:hypothetical protein
MPENWLLPTTTSNYAAGVIQAINNKFIDTITLFRSGVGSNLPINAIRYNGDLNGTFQRWSGSVWNDMILGVTGGGTGSNNPAGIRTNLGLGTMSVQNSNAVDITGGTMVGMTNIESALVNTSKVITADGSQIAAINAANIATGLINPARLANGAANSGVFLRGDQTWGAPAGTLPAGMIALFDVSCPAGWTRVVALDGRFPRGSSVYGAAGGGSSHTHGDSFAVASHTHASGTLSIPSHNHGGSTGSVSVSVTISGTTGSSGGHSHDVGATTGGESAGQMNCDAGSSGNMSRAGHTHSFTATTDSVGNHTHSFSGSGSGSGTGSISTQASVGVSGSTAATTPGLTGSITAADHTPLYLDMVFCKKD